MNKTCINCHVKTKQPAWKFSSTVIESPKTGNNMLKRNLPA